MDKNIIHTIVGTLCGKFMKLQIVIGVSLRLAQLHMDHIILPQIKSQDIPTEATVLLKTILMYIPCTQIEM